MEILREYTLEEAKKEQDILVNMEGPCGDDLCECLASDG